jgi:6-phosphogluconolactonase
MPLDKGEIQILGNADEIARAAASEFVRQSAESVKAKGLFTVSLSGGSTPKSLYSLLASETDAFRSRIPWDKIHFFWGDERHVPPDHPKSNYRMVYDTMLSKVPVPPANIHRIEAENPDAGKASEDYERVLRWFFRLGIGQFPRFDLVFLGMGPDGHTASLFPGTEVIFERERYAVASWVEKFNGYRITLTPPVLNNAACVTFLVTGEEKGDALRTVLQGGYHPERFPAQLIHPTSGRLLWMVDRAAARLLESVTAQKDGF